MRINFIIIVIIILKSNIYSQIIDFNGQVSTNAAINFNEPTQLLFGARYLPKLQLEKEFKNKSKLETELSLNTYANIQIFDFDSTSNSYDLKPYRLTLSYKTSQLEIRAGLQKINFGSAMSLRPLMWFEKIDARDPLQLTDGVYGLLTRYYFLNNANVWLWCLYGNEELKGLENIATAKNKPEFGGRFQFPVSTGELAFTYHYRKGDSLNIQNITFPIFNENRFALDGKWDLTIGIWFESALIHKDIVKELYPYQKLANLGIDYTFGIGNGLNISSELFYYNLSKEISDSGQSILFSTITANYPLGLLDNISLMIYYDYTNESLYRFANFTRTYDNLNIHLMAFWNPEQFQIYQNSEGQNVFSGKGFQIMLVYNH